jgi:hypothetical protein
VGAIARVQSGAETRTAGADVRTARDRERVLVPKANRRPVALPSARLSTIATCGKVFHQWKREGLFSDINDALRVRVCAAEGRDAEPSWGIIDSQYVRTVESGGPRGFDAGKKLKGRKRHLLGDVSPTNGCVSHRERKCGENSSKDSGEVSVKMTRYRAMAAGGPVLVMWSLAAGLSCAGCGSVRESTCAVPQLDAVRIVGSLTVPGPSPSTSGVAVVDCTSPLAETEDAGAPFTCGFSNASDDGLEFSAALGGDGWNLSHPLIGSRRSR